MNTKRASIIVITLFLILIFVIPFYWIFVDNNQEIKSVQEGRELVTFPILGCKDFSKSVNLFLKKGNRSGLRKYSKRFTQRGFQKQFEKASSDRFPYRIQMIKASNWSERQMIGAAYLFLNDPVIPTKSGNMILVTRDKTQLMRIPNSFSQAQERNIDLALDTYSELIEMLPSEHFYVFYLERIQESRFHPLAEYFPNADLGRSIAYFESKKPENLGLTKMMFSSYEDIDLFFRTDHHWNIRGVCQGYDLIYPMLAANYPEITPKLDCAQYTVLPGVKFLGSLARETLYPVEPEIFEISTVTLPPYQVFVNGKEIKETAMADYLAGEFNQAIYENHYQALYGENKEEREYYFPGNPPRNLLIIGSSYRKPLAPLLASHYQHTYTLDMRYNEDFSFIDFLKEHPVDDILFMGESNVIFMEDKWSVSP